MKTIHFICNGNLYRSRIAEAIWNAKYSDIAVATSSGARRDNHKDEYGAVSWETVYVLRKNNLAKHLNINSTQTTEDSFINNKFVVIMNSDVINNLNFKVDDALIFKSLNILDQKDEKNFEVTREYYDDIIWKIKHAETTYNNIDKELIVVAKEIKKVYEEEYGLRD
jgi:protein-tyrosine-phosphatase